MLSAVGAQLCPSNMTLKCPPCWNGSRGHAQFTADDWITGSPKVAQEDTILAGTVWQRWGKSGVFLAAGFFLMVKRKWHKGVTVWPKGVGGTGAKVRCFRNWHSMGDWDRGFLKSAPRVHVFVNRHRKNRVSMMGNGSVKFLHGGKDA